MGIANRDIKLENTLLMDETERPLLKLCDFGYSKDEYQGSACKTLCGEQWCSALILHVQPFAHVEKVYNVVVLPDSLASLSQMYLSLCV